MARRITETGLAVGARTYRKLIRKAKEKNDIAKSFQAFSWATLSLHKWAPNCTLHQAIKEIKLHLDLLQHSCARPKQATPMGLGTWCKWYKDSDRCWNLKSGKITALVQEATSDCTRKQQDVRFGCFAWWINTELVTQKRPFPESTSSLEMAPEMSISTSRHTREHSNALGPRAWNDEKRW